MNTHEPNSSELDGESVHNALINLGPASITLATFMYEVDGTPMAGTTGIDTEAFGNLSRIIQLGSGQASFSFAVTGNLIRDPHVLMGAVSALLNFSASGTMYVRSLIGPSTTGIDFNAAATINNLVRMAATTGITVTTVAALTQYVKKSIPPGAAGIDLSMTGTLSGYARMGAVQASINFDVSGLLATLIYISGDTGISFTVGGALFNNPTAQDPDGYTLVRPFVDRLLVRRS